MDSGPVQIAIVGGGLGGLSLAVALSKRSVPFVIYEANSSFTEIGAGINLNPCTIRALELIHQPLAEAVRRISTRNPPGKENIWMQAIFGAGSREGEVIAEVVAPPTGNMTVHRREILALLAQEAEPIHAEFNKKLVKLTQLSTHIQLTFADSTVATAHVVIGADGIHSQVRTCMLPYDDPAAVPTFAHCGAWRAVLPMTSLIPLLGEVRARTGQIVLGPDGYIIMYPISKGDSVNVGFWLRHREPWSYDNGTWIIPDQYQRLVENFSDWGETVQRIISICPKDLPFWGSFHHGSAIKQYFKGRIAVLGDAAHSMTPHQGAGAGQAIEDAYVLAEVLSTIYAGDSSEMSNPLPSTGSSAVTLGKVEGAAIEKPHGSMKGASLLDRCPSTPTQALRAYSLIRQPRAQRVLETSHGAFDRWANFYHDNVTEEEVGQFKGWLDKNFRWIWDDDIISQADKAKSIVLETRRANFTENGVLPPPK